jgi:hypothetical protein
MTQFSLLDGTNLAMVTPLPIVGPNGGAYSKGMTSGIMAAGLAGGAIIYAFRYAPATAGPNLCLVRRVLLSATCGGTGFTAGIGHIDLFAARAFSANDTGGTAATLSGNNAKLRTSFVTTGVADIRISSTAALGAGTRVPDTDPLGSVEVTCSNTANVVMAPPNSILFDDKIAEYPLVLATSEGFEVNATVTATGVWGFSITTVWEEVEKF